MVGNAGGAAGAARLGDHPVLGPAPLGETVRITFDGTPVDAVDGEPLIVALLAGGHRVLRTMPSHEEPRGGFCMVGRCPDCLVVVDGLPNVRACVTPVRAGMAVETQHGLGPETFATTVTSR